MNSVSIVIYGKNSCDHTVNAKYKQIKRYGFSTYIYIKADSLSIC
jgi:hypothetical protein